MQRDVAARAGAVRENPLLRLAQPWPDAEQMLKRKAQAEALRLFAAEDPTALTLRDDESRRKRYSDRPGSNIDLWSRRTPGALCWIEYPMTI